MPNNPLPPTPDYNGAAAPVTPTGSSGSSDIWNLNDLYGLPVFLGTVNGQAPIEGSRGGISPNGPTRPVSSDKFGTTQDIMQQVLHLWSQQQAERKHNPNALTGYEQLQQQLYAAGFYGQTAFDKIHVGQWTNQTQSALVNALGSYEQSRSGGAVPVTFSEFLSGNAAQNKDGGFYGDGSSGTAPTQVALQDPATIREAAQSAAMSALGQGLSPDQLSKFVAQFQAAQSAAQTSTAGSVTSPDLSSDAMAFAQSSNPAGYHDTQRQSYTSALVNLLTGPGGAGRPSTSPVPAVTK